VDFKNVVLIMTSNIGSRHIIEGHRAGLPREKVEEAVEAEMRATFRPEFLNRVDEVIVFDSLKYEDMDRILEIQLRHIRRLVEGRQLDIVVSPAARKALCDAGFDPLYGARPLKRAIQQYLMNPMSRAIVAGSYGPRDTVRVDVKDDSLSFERVPGAPPKG
jgi:ATP-dependent Clp protease ATP-binding subunit ClpB